MHGLDTYLHVYTRHTKHFSILSKNDRKSFVSELFEPEASPEYILHDAKENAFDDTGQYLIHVVNSAGV